MAKTERLGWPGDIYRALKGADVRQVAYVPEVGHKWLIDRCRKDRAMRTLSMTSEEEGVAVLAGAWLGGERGALLMQSSGVGNCINMLSITQECRFPLLMVVTMRGEWGEFNPWQAPMGQATEPVLTAAGVIVQRVDDAERVGETVAAASHMAFDAMRAVAVLIGQRLIGAKDWSK